MKILNSTITIFSTLLLVGCAGISASPPMEHDFKKSRTYNMDFEKVWLKAVDWFAQHDITIDKLEKPSGFISAKYRLEADDNLLDCGDIKGNATWGKPDIMQTGSLNFTVREISPEKTLVNINFFGEFEALAEDIWTSSRVKSSGRCSSTGELETRALNFIEEN